MPEILEVTRLSADSVVTVGTSETGVSSMSPSKLSISQVNAIDSVTTDNLTVEDTATTKNLTVTGGITMGDVQVLTQTYADILRPLTITYSDDSTGTLTAIVHTKVCNINNEQHLLTCQLELKGLSKAITEMVIPTCLVFSGRSTDSHNATAALVNGSRLLLGLFASMWKMVFLQSR